MVGYNGLGWNKILMELGWIYPRNFFPKKKIKTKNNWKFYTVHGVEMLKRYVALILPTNQTEFGF